MKPISTRRVRNRLQQEALVQASAYGEVFINAQMTMDSTSTRLLAEYLLAAADDADRGAPLAVSSSELPARMPARGAVPRASVAGMDFGDHSPDEDPELDSIGRGEDPDYLDNQ